MNALDKNFRGIITISGPTKSGKSKFAEFLIKDHENITYIATSKPRLNDPDWENRIDTHRRRRPLSWKLVEHPPNICQYIESCHSNESILIDSLGGLVEQYIMIKKEKWDLFQNDFINCLKNTNLVFIIVVEEIGWGIVPSTALGNLFRERLCEFSSLLNTLSIKKWFVVQGSAIDLDQIGYRIQ